MKKRSHEEGNLCTGAHRLSVRDLHVHYGRICALDGIDLDFNCGQAVGIFGPNGAGKSTLLKSIAGLIPAAAGHILWNDEPLTRARREVAYLPQREEADFTYPITVRGVVEMGRFPDLGWFRRFRRADHEAVDNAIATMDLANLQNRQIRALSGGQQQRVFLARAIAQGAHVLLLDEPFTGLDAPSHQRLSDLLQRLASEGRLLICTHHGVHEAANLFDQVILLNRKLVVAGPPSLLENPEHRAAVRL